MLPIPGKRESALAYGQGCGYTGCKHGYKGVTELKKLRFRHLWMLAMGVLIALFHLLAKNRKIMNALAYGTLPLRQALGRLCSHLPVSVAEILCTIGVLAVIAWLGWTVVSVCRRKPRLLVFWRRLSLLIAVAMTLYLLLCILLGASYRADSFQDRSGLRAQPTSVEALYEVTALFTEKLIAAAETVPRGADGQFSVPDEAVFDAATEIYRGAETLFPFLKLADVTPKRAIYSHIMSICNYTGFYFPFTGEAHINIEPPPALMPATIAHEMAHQRGVASELEANFVAVLACTESGNAAYAYSGWLFGWIHLGNALYRYAPETYYELARALPEAVWADLRANDDFWAKYETKAAAVSDKVYDTMLKTYGQELGVQSYGAVVDLLIAWAQQGGFQ